MKPKKKVIVIQHPTNQFLPSTIEVFGCLHNRRMCFYVIMPTPLGVQRARGPSSLCFDYVSSLKKITYIARDISTLYLNLADNVNLTIS
jgi:hypothetical protein